MSTPNYRVPVLPFSECPLNCNICKIRPINVPVTWVSSVLFLFLFVYCQFSCIKLSTVIVTSEIFFLFSLYLIIRNIVGVWGYLGFVKMSKPDFRCLFPTAGFQVWYCFSSIYLFFLSSFLHFIYNILGEIYILQNIYLLILCS